MPPLYPAGLGGVGLLLLRLSVAGSLGAMNLPFSAAADLRQITALLLAVTLCLGVGVRAIALLSLLWIPGSLAGDAAWPLFAALHVVIALALAFTGAGAYSLDARMFGRRRVKLPGRYDTSE